MGRHISGAENCLADAIPCDDLTSFQHLVQYVAREPSRLPEQLLQWDTGLDTGQLDYAVQLLFISELATSTQRTCSCGQHQYIHFCKSTQCLLGGGGGGEGGGGGRGGGGGERYFVSLWPSWPWMASNIGL